MRIRGELLFSNNCSDLLRSISIRQNPPKIEKQEFPFERLTVINFEQKENAFDQTSGELNRNNLVMDFFPENIRNLLESAAKIKTIEIKESAAQYVFDEEMTINLQFGCYTDYSIFKAHFFGKKHQL